MNDHAMDGATEGAINMAAALNEQHVCNRYCSFTNLFGNVFTCQTSGSVHVCDNTCNQRVWVDPYTSVCRLSKRSFQHAPHELPQSQARKRGGAEESDAAATAAVKRTCSGHFQQNPMQAI